MFPCCSKESQRPLMSMPQGALWILAKVFEKVFHNHLKNLIIYFAPALEI